MEVINKSFIMAQILGAISGIFLACSGWQKKRKRILLFQIIDCTAAVIGYILLGAHSAVVIASFALIRNIVSYKKAASKRVVLIFIALSVVSTVLVSDMTKIINYIPIVASVTYTYSLSYSKAAKIKGFLVLNSVLWLIYNIFTGAYTSAITNIAVTIITLISLKLKREE